MFSVCFRRCRRRCGNDFCLSRQNHLSYIWDKESIGLGKCTGWPLTQGHSWDIDKHKFASLQDKVRTTTTQPITTKLCSYILLGMLITRLVFVRIMLQTLILPNFLLKFLMCFFKLEHISGMVGAIDVEQKEGASVRYWVNHMTLTFDLTHDLDLVVSRSKFEIALFEEWGRGGGGWLTWNERDMSWSFMTMTVTYG